jgi:hypothetical protein
MTIYKDTLKNSVEKIVKFCNDNGISIFYGTVDENVSNEASWDESEINNLGKYLETIKKTETKIIILDIGINEIEEEDFESFEDSLKDNDDEELVKDFENSIKIVKDTNGYVFEFTISYFYHNVSYSLNTRADWFDHYEEMYDNIFSSDYEDPYEYDLNKLSDERVEEIARKILSDVNYLNSKNNQQRYQIAESIVKQEEHEEIDYRNMSYIRRKAEFIFENEIKPIQENELKNKILELKKKNLKKIEITSKLGITMATLNKYYFADEE